MSELDQYVWYIGEPMPSTSLWVRRDGGEYPIYSNTRGQCEWSSFSTDEYENTAQTPLSDAFIEWLAHYYRARNGLMDDDVESGILANIVEADQPDGEPEWYETECLNHIGSPITTEEQEELLEWAYNKVDNE